MRMMVITPQSNRITNDELKKNWTKLGIAFADESTGLSVDLELSLLLSLNLMAGQKKYLRLIRDWLLEFGDLVHVERLLALLRANSWIGESSDVQEIRILASIADQLHENGDRRWGTIREACRKILKDNKALLPVRAEDEYLAERHGLDPQFKKFGLLIPKLDGGSHHALGGSMNKKFRKREAILMMNPWLRLRAALGANWRADVLFVILTDLAENPFQTSRMLGCSYETAHRIWRAFSSARARDIFQTNFLAG